MFHTEMLSNLLFSPCGRMLPRWFAEWSRETKLTTERCARRALRAVYRNGPQGAGRVPVPRDGYDNDPFILVEMGSGMRGLQMTK